MFLTITFCLVFTVIALGLCTIPNMYVTYLSDIILCQILNAQNVPKLNVRTRRVKYRTPYI